MTIKFMRQDKDGNPVEVEIWRDEESGQFVRIKRITYLKKINFTRQRSDIYRLSDAKEFNKAFAEEIDFLNEYEQAKKNILISASQLQRMKEEGQM